MTAPLTPKDCDLQDFPFMPLHVARLRDSDLAAQEHPEACWYAVLLWAASWHQLPAGSLPNDDAVMTRLIGLGRDVRTFRKHKAAALRGFVLCEDGRLYHPVVAEQVVAAWEGKLQQRWRTECARIKKHNQRTGEALPQPAYEAWLSRETAGAVPPSVPKDKPHSPQGQRLQGTETGTETGTSSSVSDETGAEAPSGRLADEEDLDPLADLRALPVAKGSWRLAVKVLVEQGRMTETKARNFVGGKLRGAGLSEQELWDVAEAAFEAETEDPQSYLIKAAEGVIERRNASRPAFGPRLRNPPDDHQRGWMRDFRDGFEWKEHDRGPKPGRPGCQVNPEIQREFGVEPAKPLPVSGRAA